jgi:hypothetical protein
MTSQILNDGRLGPVLGGMNTRRVYQYYSAFSRDRKDAR